MDISSVTSFDWKKGKITKVEYEIKICLINKNNADLYLFLDDNFCLIKISSKFCYIAFIW